MDLILHGISYGYLIKPRPLNFNSFIQTHLNHFLLNKTNDIDVHFFYLTTNHAQNINFMYPKHFSCFLQYGIHWVIIICHLPYIIKRNTCNLWNSDTLFKWCWCPILVLDTDRHSYDTCRHVSVKCSIQKIFVKFLIILIRFEHNFKKEKYINFLKIQILLYKLLLWL